MPKSLMIRNIQPGLVERGKIKIGVKGEKRQSRQGGEFQLPKRLDHFVVTTLHRDSETNNFVVDREIHEKLGTGKPTQLGVRLLYDDIELNFPSRYVAYQGRTLARSCDGETCEQRQGDGSYVEQACMCRGLDLFDERHCKPSGVLSVMLDAADVVGGVWKFRTTSYNTVRGIMSSMMLIKSITGGPLAGIPLVLTITPKAVTNPKDNTQQTVHIVSLEYRGREDDLRAIGVQRALQREKQRQQIEQIEQVARAMLAPPTALQDEDTIEEFFPREAAREEGVEVAEDGPPALAAPEPAAKPQVAPAPEPQKKPDASSEKPSLALISADGEVVGDYKRGGDWVNGLEKLVSQASEEQRSAIWAANEGTAQQIIDRFGEKNPQVIARLNAIRQQAEPPQPEPEPEPEDEAVEQADDGDEDWF